MTWYSFNCKVCWNEEEIGMYFPDYYDHFPEHMPDWTIEVVCADCRKAPEQGLLQSKTIWFDEIASIYID